MSAPINYAANWLRWDLWDAVNGTCSNNELPQAKHLPFAQQDLDAGRSTAPGTAA